MRQLSAAGPQITPNGSFRLRRTHTPDPIRPVVLSLVEEQVAAGAVARPKDPLTARRSDRLLGYLAAILTATGQSAPVAPKAGLYVRFAVHATAGSDPTAAGRAIRGS